MNDNLDWKDALSDSTKDFWVPASRQVVYLDNPSPIEFARFALGQYQPVIIRGVMEDWHACHSWSMEYLQRQLGKETPITVNMTPDGLADAVKVHSDSLSTPRERVFTYPLEHTMTVGSFSDALLHPSEGDAVPYLSTQNDNFRQCFSSLSQDVPNHIGLAEAAFGLLEPEAVNLWIGDERSISSLHKDHFENFYAVISGAKTFTLLPPTDVAFLPEGEFPSCSYKLRNSNERHSPDQRLLKSDLELEAHTMSSRPPLRWVDFDPEPDSSESTMSHPHLSPIRCTVHTGELLYIPAMWYHRVSQKTLTIAVNYWYDQQFDFRYVFYSLSKAIATAAPPTATELEHEHGET